MPFLLRALILWLHLLAAMTWIGAVVFLVLVVFPTLARVAPTGERLRFALSLEARFRVIVWPAVGLVLFTGLVNLMNVWYVTIVTAGNISPTFVPILSVKLCIVLGMIALQAVQQLLVYPKRLAALSGVSAGVQDMPLAFRKWQRLTLVLYGTLLSLAGVVVWCAVLLRGV
jgi:putative copper resistance protein D